MNLATFLNHPPAAGVGLAAEAARLGPWFHNLHLPDGTQTAPAHPLGDFPARLWRMIELHLPADLHGWRVLDIGCNAGFYSLAAARRGALVTGIDVDEHFLRQARWASAQEGLEERITLRQLDVYSLAEETTRYDLVLFMGVFYHLRHPLLGLDLAAARAERLLVFQTLTTEDAAHPEVPVDLPYEQIQRLQTLGWPHMAFVEHSLAGDPTNWWVPNRNALDPLLRSSGLTVLATPGPGIRICAPRAAARSRTSPPLPPRDRLRS